MGASGLIENCAIHDCGGGGVLVALQGSQSSIRKCDVYRSHIGLEAREETKSLTIKKALVIPERLLNDFTAAARIAVASSDDVGCLMKCPLCHIASYCCQECQRNHRPKHETLCLALKSRYSQTVDTVSSKGIGKGPKLKRDSSEKFIVKIQTQDLNSHPLQMLAVNNQSHTIVCRIQSPQIFNVIMECGVLEAFLDEKFTGKKCFSGPCFPSQERG
ncbi:hypothetical protein OS493_021349 [Desmophyllum pertusum]|uniref:MYND-type domain-containing protein n=1 Tax=Desmophyllum pertusum TaxID=174260 RepID=A0A9X0CY82_9CNID|nr:hypothetical protein OS493_021349 [Desmophyllum pertusum]